MTKLWIPIAMVATALHAGTPHRIVLNTFPANVANWTVWEVSNGQLVSATPTSIGKYTYGNVWSMTFPFTDNDGFWYADIKFNLPSNARKVALRIHSMGIDDRAVVQLNGNDVTAVGTNSGNGYMTFSDGGTNGAYTFPFFAGKMGVIYRSNFVAGENDLRIYVNNTGDGIYGSPVPESEGGPTNVGINADVTYMTPK